MSLNVFYVVVLRTFFKGIPLEIIEAAHMDGAGEFYTFLRIVLPLSKPGVATIGLFTVIAYWNDWFLGMLYIFETEKYPIQTLLQSMQNSLEALTQSSANALEYAEMAKNAPHRQRPDGSDGSGGAAGYAGLPLLPEIFRKGTYRRRRKRLSTAENMCGCTEYRNKKRICEMRQLRICK